MTRSRAERSFSGEETVERDGYILFWKPPSIFGQWTPSPFTIDGVAYGCAEQYMMAEKARLFSDEETLRKILKADDPRKHKRLGQQVKPFDAAIWDAERFQIVVRGNMAKFGQNPDLQRQLLATGEKTLVEASPLDRIWGIGLRADNPKATDPAQWRGQNLLGKALMEVRTKLG